MKLFTLIPALALSLGVTGCGDKIPEKYTALGIPPAPQLVQKIEYQKEDNTYQVTYKPAVSLGHTYVEMLQKIRAAGYTEQEGSGPIVAYYGGPQGTFALSYDDKVEPITLYLTPDRTFRNR